MGGQLVWLVVCGVWMVWGVVEGQTFSRIEQVVQQSFATGDMSLLDTLTAPVFLVQLGGERQQMGKAQALHAIGSFVRRAPPTSFHVVHSGSAGTFIRYLIGRYVSRENHVYRVYIMFKYSQQQGRYIIHEIRIDSL